MRFLFQFDGPSAVWFVEASSEVRRLFFLVIGQIIDTVPFHEFRLFDLEGAEARLDCLLLPLPCVALLHRRDRSFRLGQP